MFPSKRKQGSHRGPPKNQYRTLSPSRKRRLRLADRVRFQTSDPPKTGWPFSLVRGVAKKTVPSYGFTPRDGVQISLGSAEIRVPGKFGVEYASPTLIYRYINDHSYPPAKEFIGAVMALEVET